MPTAVSCILSFVTLRHRSSVHTDYPHYNGGRETCGRCGRIVTSGLLATLRAVGSSVFDAFPLMSRPRRYHLPEGVRHPHPPSGWFVAVAVE
ncbi:hypothetical protein EDD17DRAFT_1142604 [Pisolithus thermaeus]|nr:hypothetical protein EV401DRAFT_208611 [Pisolithus croceorrhizus]KAI6151413.1 hypothetical protein EDD17DRAFT_1142604 [Pisolithus thermaeus]